MENYPGDINTNIVTKVTTVRAVDLSIGPFCTEFQCEHFCDDDVLRGIDYGGREIDHGVGKLIVGLGKLTIGVGKSAGKRGT